MADYKSAKYFTVECIVDLCESGFGFEASMILGAMVDILNPNLDNDFVAKRLSLFQRKIKYGLIHEGELNLYELGFSDRVIARHLLAKVGESASKSNIRVKIKRTLENIIERLSEFPSYYALVSEKIAS